MLIDSTEQVFPLATNLYIGLVHPPGGRAITLVPADPLLELRCVTVDPAHDRGRIYLEATFLHHLHQIAVGDPVLAVPAYADQNDLHRKRRRLNTEGAPWTTAPDYAILVTQQNHVTSKKSAAKLVPLFGNEKELGRLTVAAEAVFPIFTVKRPLEACVAFMIGSSNPRYTDGGLNNVTGNRSTAWPDTPRADIHGTESLRLETAQAGLDLNWRETAVQRVLTSSSFSKTNRLSAFLEYVCRLTLDGREHEINEVNIGISVFERRENYNASDDTIVRTTARGLRQRLKSYYETEGLGDAVRIDIPKGAYVPTFIQIQSDPDRILLDDGSALDEGVVATPIVASPETHRSALWSRNFAALVVTFLVALGIGAACALMWTAPKRYVPWTRTPSDKLWRQLFPSDRTTFIVPADTILLQYELKTHRAITLDEYLGGNFLRPVDASIPGVAELMQHYRNSRYTAVTSVQMAETFGQIPKLAPDRTQVRFTRDLQTGDLNNSNCILIGASQNNPWVQLFRKELNFHLDWVPAEDRWHIRNDHPEAAEVAEWPWTGHDPTRTSYSHIALVHNLSGNGFVLILSGTNMFGSEAGSNFLFNAEKMDPLLKKALRSDGSLGTFEILLESNVVGNGTINTHVAATRFH